MISHQFWKLPKKIPFPELTLTNFSWFFYLNSVIFLTYKSRKKVILPSWHKFKMKAWSRALLSMWYLYETNLILCQKNSSNYVRFQHFITQVKFKTKQREFFLFLLFFHEFFRWCFQYGQLCGVFSLKLWTFLCEKGPWALIPPVFILLTSQRSTQLYRTE